MKLRYSLLPIVAVLASLPAAAQLQLSDLKVESRMAWHGEMLGGSTQDAATGFRGRYLNFIAAGNITDNITFYYRQRLNRAHADESFFSATDFLFVDWTFGNWTLSGGKQELLIGGFEYDGAPINTYFWGEHNSFIACYQPGVSIARNFENDSVTAQVCQSPAGRNNLYAYNLFWKGSHGIYSSLSSVNLLEYTKGAYLGAIALGNRITTDRFCLSLDLMLRGDGFRELIMDRTICTQAKFKATETIKLFAQWDYDCNDSETNHDFCVLPGTRVNLVGGGVEYRPFNDSDNVRLYAFAGESFGHNTNISGVWTDKHLVAEVGCKITLDFLNIKK